MFSTDRVVILYVKKKKSPPLQMKGPWLILEQVMIRVATAWIVTLVLSQGDEPNTYSMLENILRYETGSFCLK